MKLSKVAEATDDMTAITISQSWEIGAHTGFSGSIHDSLAERISYGMYTTQFFLGNPKGFKRHQASSEDIERSRGLLRRFPLHVFTHFPYIANLAGSVKSLAWHGDAEQDAKTNRVLAALEYELGVVASLGCSEVSKRSGVVIHPGAYGAIPKRRVPRTGPIQATEDRTVGLLNIAKTINKINFPPGSRLLLENAAGQGRALATEFTELKTIVEAVHPDKRSHLGVCVDTAHIFGYGSYDLRRVEEVDRMFEEFDAALGPSMFTLLHLNDTRMDEGKAGAPFGSCKDRHECIGQGHIWSKSPKSLLHLLALCKERGIPIVLETTVADLITMSSLGKMCRTRKREKKV